MLARLGKPSAGAGTGIGADRLAQAYLHQVDEVKRILAHHAGQVECLSVPYHGALGDPATTAARVNAFLGGQLDSTAMAAAVDPLLRHQGLRHQGLHHQGQTEAERRQPIE